MEPQPATDDSESRRGRATPRLWLVRGGGGGEETEPSAPVQGNGRPGDPVPRARLQAIFLEAERGAEKLVELSDDLAHRTAEVIRCRAELIVARRLSELLRLRRESVETPERVSDQVGRLRIGVEALGARLPGRE